jgi:hypothetical protein
VRGMSPQPSLRVSDPTAVTVTRGGSVCMRSVCTTAIPTPHGLSVKPERVRCPSLTVRHLGSASK